jgi:hypothetical protein
MSYATVCDQCGKRARLHGWGWYGVEAPFPSGHRDLCSSACLRDWAAGRDERVAARKAAS